MRSTVDTFTRADFEQACPSLDDDTDSMLDSLAYLLEQGLCYHTQGDYAASNEVFFRALAEIDEAEAKAVISASDTAAGLGTLMVNEKVSPYRGEIFEKVLLHAYLAMNFLMLGEPESARVEVRRMHMRLKDAERAQEDELEAARERFRQDAARNPAGAPDETGVAGTAQQLFEEHRAVLARVPDAFRYQDAFAYYLSGLTYQAQRPPEYNDAYIDLKKVIQLRPDARFLGPELVRLARASRLDDEYRKWSHAFPRTATPPENAGHLVILYESGLAPWKKQASLVIPVGGGKLAPLSLPAYVTRPNPASRAALFANNGSMLGTTSVLSDVEAIAIKSLQDRMPSLIFKQLIRTTLKTAVANQADDQGARALINLINIITEQADQRSWLLLPQNLQVLRVSMLPGRHHLKIAIQAPGGGTLDVRTVQVEVRTGELSIVNLRSAGPKILAVHVAP